jgi:hypothetical protein
VYMHNTHARARVSRFTRYYRVTCDFIRRAVASSAVQWIEGERCLRTDAGDLRPTRVSVNQVSGKCARMTAHALSSACSSSTVSSSIHTRDPL